MKGHQLKSCFRTKLVSVIVMKCHISWYLHVWLLMSVTARAQESTVLTYSDSGAGHVQIKWYDSDFIRGAYHVYRKGIRESDWLKLTDHPITRKAGISEISKTQDPDLAFFVDLVQQSTLIELNEDFILLNILIKTFRSNEFADFLGVYYKDTTARPGATYRYRVTRIVEDDEIDLGVSSEVTVGLGEANQAVSGISIEQAEQLAHINWQVDDDRFYAVNIYRRDETDTLELKRNDNPVLMGQKPDSSGKLVYPNPMYADDSLVAGTHYTYRIVGVSYFENETRSVEVPFVFEDKVAPTAPYNLKGKADTMKVSLEWEAALEEDLTGFNVYRSILSDGPFGRINASTIKSNQFSFRDSLTVPGPYYYYISSEDLAGNESNSYPIYVEVPDVIPPAPPSEIKIQADTGKLTITWRKNSEPDLAGYLIYRTIEEDDPVKYVLLNATPQKDTFFVQKFPENVKNEIYFKLVAIDTSFNRSDYSSSLSAQLPDVTGPTKPQIKTVKVNKHELVVEWFANVDNDLFGYKLLRSKTPDSTSFTQVNVGTIRKTSTRYSDRNVEFRTKYYYVLQALDSTGNLSEFSNPQKGEIKYVPYEATAGSLRIRHLKRKRQNVLTWQFKVENNLMGYVLYRGETTKNLRPITGLIKEEFYTDQVAGNKIYYYQVRSFTNTGIIGRSIIAESNSK